MTIGLKILVLTARRDSSNVNIRALDHHLVEAPGRVLDGRVDGAQTTRSQQRERRVQPPGDPAPAAEQQRDAGDEAV